MQVVTILYPNGPDAHFDFDYYLSKHIPWSEDLNQSKFEITKGVGDFEGNPPKYICIARLPIRSLEEFIAVMTGPGAALIEDMRNYTNIDPVIQIDEVVR